MKNDTAAGNQSLAEQEVVIRCATSDDLPFAVSIEQACFGTEALPAISLVQYRELFPATFLIAVQGTERLGLAIAGASAEEPQSAWLLDIAVHPAAQGRGIATRLLDVILELCRTQGIHTLMATVAPANRASAGLLLKAGFKCVGHNPRYFGEGEPRDILRLEL